MDTILVGFDGSDHAYAALRFAVDEAKMRSARLRILCVWELPAESWGEFPPPERTLERYQEKAKEIVAEAGAIVEREAPGLEVEQLTVEGRAGSALLENAFDVSMIVLGTRGHGGFTGLLLGSVSQEVIGNAAIPVVVVPSPET